MSEDLKASRYEPIALSNESTVVAEFVPDSGGARNATRVRRNLNAALSGSYRLRHTNICL